MKVNFQDLNLNIGGEAIEIIGTDCDTKYFNFVGHHVEEFLRWEHQINHVHSKLSGACVKNFVPLYIQKTLYNSLFCSQLELALLA